MQMSGSLCSMRKRLISDSRASCTPDPYFHSGDRKGKEVTVAAIEKPVQWMTSQELRDELYEPAGSTHAQLARRIRSAE